MVTMKRKTIMLIDALVHLRELLSDDFENPNPKLLDLVDKTLTKLLTENNIQKLN